MFTNQRTRITCTVAALCLIAYVATMELLHVASSAMAVHTSSVAVSRTVDQFLVFSRQHNDASTAVEAFLLQQFPDSSLTLAAAADGNLVEVAYSPRSLGAKHGLLHTMLSSPASSGVINDDDDGPIPWARVTVDGADRSTATLLVAHFTDDAMGFARQNVQLTGIIGAIIVIVIVLATWGGAGMFNTRITAEAETVAFQASATATTTDTTATTALRSPQ